MNKYILEIVVFVCGAAVMIYELIGTRVLAPYFGTSLIVWTSLIGIILGSLSAGYWYGGKISDTKADVKILSNILFIAGIFIGLTTFLYYDLLFIIDTMFSHIIVKTIVSTVLLFAPPSVLLGMVSPYAVKLKAKNMDSMGKTVGNLYAVSTIGSITGTFLAGFYLIPQFGTNNILIILSALLIICSTACLQRPSITQRLALLVVYLLLLGIGYYLNNTYAVKDYILDIDTQYSRIQISDITRNSPIGSDSSHNKIRLMKINGLLSTGIALNNNGELFLEYAKYYSLAKHFNKNIHKALMLGGAGYAYPVDYLAKYPDATMDVVEIDPVVTELAKKYFNLRTDKRLTIYHEDGRTFINKSDHKYDVIFNDTFSSYYSLPYQLTTREAIQKMHDLLYENGLVLVNIISAIEGKKGEFLRAEYRTFKSIFPRVYLFPVTNAADGEMVQNVMLVALKSNAEIFMRSNKPELDQYLGHLWKKEVVIDTPILTDDHAPVDYYVNKMLVSP